MDEKVLNYRKKHKRCKFCKYLELTEPPFDCVPSYYRCVAKDKVIKDLIPDMTEMPRMCSCYEVKEEL